MEKFQFLIFITGALLVFSSVYFYRRFDDILHPSMMLGSLFFFLYVGMPAYLLYENTQIFLRYIPIEKLIYVQTLNLAGIGFLIAGFYFGSKGIRRLQKNAIPVSYSRSRTYAAAQIIGLLGMFVFLTGLGNVGGLESAYDQAYGGGGHSSGYLREAYMLGVPAMILMIYSRTDKKLRQTDLMWILIFMAPLIIHGLLGARRGPLFMVLIGFTFAYYMSRGRRPSFSRMTGLIFTTGILLLFLVANRDNIYLGSEEELDNSPTELLLTLEQNEYTYGSASILLADRTQNYYWGGRYIAVMLIRPIPKELFPNKYQFASEWLGIPDLEKGNMGINNELMRKALGWRGAYGAAPGIIADLWVEFWAFMTVAMFTIGFVFSRIWRNAVTTPGTAMFHYPLLISLSAYLVMQTFEAFIFRALFYSAFTYAAVYFSMKPERVNRSRHQPVTAITQRLPQSGS